MTTRRGTIPVQTNDPIERVNDGAVARAAGIERVNDGAVARAAGIERVNDGAVARAAMLRARPVLDVRALLGQKSWPSRALSGTRATRLKLLGRVAQR
jgi:hypothetical protein